MNSSITTSFSYFKANFGESPAQLATLNLIITPEFIKRIANDHPEVHMYAFRLDRGMSPPDVLDTIPGTRWDEESGLTSTHYIVPGGGGLGEIMNNAYV